jgi:hypothetical protein
VQITGFGGPEILIVVDLPDPVPGDGVRAGVSGSRACGESVS